jgi:hypothetical protein
LACLPFYFGRGELGACKRGWSSGHGGAFLYYQHSRMEAGGLEVDANMGYIVRSCPRKENKQTNKIQEWGCGLRGRTAVL